MDLSFDGGSESFYTLVDLCERAAAAVHRGPEWRRLKTFCVNTLANVQNGSVNAADADDLLVQYIDLNAQWHHSIGYMLEQGTITWDTNIATEHPEYSMEY